MSIFPSSGLSTTNVNNYDKISMGYDDMDSLIPIFLSLSKKIKKNKKKNKNKKEKEKLNTYLKKRII